MESKEFYLVIYFPMEHNFDECFDFMADTIKRELMLKQEKLNEKKSAQKPKHLELTPSDINIDFQAMKKAEKVTDALSEGANLDLFLLINKYEQEFKQQVLKRLVQYKQNSNL